LFRSFNHSTVKHFGTRVVFWIGGPYPSCNIFTILGLSRPSIG
jgi:hypothetical protein